MEDAQRTNKQLHAVFLDFEKAFDRVNHDYLLNVLKEREFGDQFHNFISAFLKGTCRVRFNGALSDPLSIGRGVPQGETLSPFLFILAIDPLLRSIQQDPSIAGIKVGSHRVKVMTYADDIVLISDNKADLEKMLEHVKTYERASNAKLSEKKSQILSFGGDQLEKISEIKRCADLEKVRHLGIFFNKDGIVNNIDEILPKLERKLSLLRNLHPNFTCRVNLWKGYAISSLLYQSEFLCITPEQVQHLERLQSWFLFHQSRHEGKLEVFSENKRYISNINFDRLAEPKNKGGMNLHRISQVFGASKTKTLVRATTSTRKDQPCYVLIRKRVDQLFQQQAKRNLVHPLFSEHITNNTSNKWEWFHEAAQFYADLRKRSTFFPQDEGQLVLNSEETAVMSVQDFSEPHRGLVDVIPVNPPPKTTHHHSPQRHQSQSKSVDKSSSARILGLERPQNHSSTHLQCNQGLRHVGRSSS